MCATKNLRNISIKETIQIEVNHLRNLKQKIYLSSMNTTYYNWFQNLFIKTNSYDIRLTLYQLAFISGDHEHKTKLE